MNNVSKSLVFLMLMGLTLMILEILVLRVEVPNISMAVFNTQNARVAKKDQLFNTQIKPEENMKMNIYTNKSNRESVDVSSRRTKITLKKKITSKFSVRSDKNRRRYHNGKGYFPLKIRKRELHQYNSGFNLTFNNGFSSNLQINDDKLQRHAEKNQVCTFSFDEKSLLEAKETLSDLKSFYLYYVNLETSTDIFQNFSKEESDDLLHWQYVQKKENYLVQLPIDFDILTFNILNWDNEEKILNVKILNNNSNCGKHFAEDLQAVKNLLWTDLFQNDTDFYLCNRHFEPDVWRHLLYFLTTIWIGYDFNCSQVTETSFIQDVHLNKDYLPLIKPCFCYILSFQFVWIFVFLDFDPFRQQPDFNANSYYKNDRPYGIKRFILKVLFKKSTRDIHRTHDKPIDWLLLYMWIIIIFPFGLMRTIGRYVMSNSMNQDYADIVRPNEFFLRILPNDILILIFDVLYAVVVPLFYLRIGAQSYKIFMKEDVWCFPCVKICDIKDTKEKRVLAQNKNIRDKFAFPSYMCYKQCCEICSEHCFEQCCDKKVSILSHVCMSFLSCLYCLFPCIPFSCNTYNTCKCLIKRNSELSNSKTSLCINICKLIFCMFLTYVLCLRQILSTVTFMLRMFTYLVFVTFLMRAHIMQYALLAVTTVGYIFQYLSQIVNMNAEILNFIFEIRRTTDDADNVNSISSNDNTIDENLFENIYVRLRFVRNEYHWFFLKMFIIVGYILIAIETFVTNRASLNESNVHTILQLLLILVSPYAVSFIFETNSFLSEENKVEIRQAYVECTNNEEGNDETEDGSQNDYEIRICEMFCGSERRQDGYEDISDTEI